MKSKDIKTARKIRQAILTKVSGKEDKIIFQYEKAKELLNTYLKVSLNEAINELSDEDLEKIASEMTKIALRMEEFSQIIKWRLAQQRLDGEEPQGYEEEDLQDGVRPVNE